MSDNNAGQLMNALISKMESMDNDIQAVRAENAMLRKAFDNPQLILRKAGFVPYSTPLSEDVQADAFRADMHTAILKGAANENQLGLDAYTNEEVHEMSWDEIHEMAEGQIERKEMY